MSDTKAVEIEVLVVGAGFGGLYMLHRLRQLGIAALVVDTSADVGGCWYWNRYPGARCDVESVLYSYSFSPEIDASWKWSERYASDREIQAYLSHVADLLDLRRDIRFNSTVSAAVFDEANNYWNVEIANGDHYRARHVILATGPLTVGKMPEIEGIDQFSGATYHTANWPREHVDLTGKRVGVIGTGSSGTQLVPVVAEQAEHLFVFVRTPNYTVPARNFKMTDEHQKFWETHRDELRDLQQAGQISGSGEAFVWDRLKGRQFLDARKFTPEERQEILEERWEMGGATVLHNAFARVLVEKDVNELVGSFVRNNVEAKVNDPVTAEIVTPLGYAFGTKRLCVDSGYYEAFNRPNVEAVNCRKAPIVRISENGVVTADGTEYRLDVIVFATGFDAMTGAVTKIDLRGKGGRTIQEAWAAGPDNFLGISINGFPNLFLIGGPGSPSALSNVVMANEHHVDFLADLILTAKAKGKTAIEPLPEIQRGWVEHCAEVAAKTMLDQTDSWYVGANVPGKARVVLPYTGGYVAYKRRCDAVAASGYAEFGL